MLFLWLNKKAPPEGVLPLAVERVFTFEYFSLFFEKVFRKQGGGGGAVLLHWAY
jgi:hypothetical protein